MHLEMSSAISGYIDFQAPLCEFADIYVLTNWATVTYIIKFKHDCWNSECCYILQRVILPENIQDINE